MKTLGHGAFGPTGAVGSKHALQKAALGCSCHVRFKDPCQGSGTIWVKGQVCEQLAAESLAMLLSQAFKWLQCRTMLTWWHGLPLKGETMGICTCHRRIYSGTSSSL
jgi:hypothetical protein